MVKKKKQTDTPVDQQDMNAAGHDNRQENGNKMTGDSNDQEKNVAELEAGLREEIAMLNDKYLRLYSDFDNYRKRTQRERAEMLKTAASGLITQLLPVLDDFERAVRSFETAKDLNAIREGIDLIHGKFRKVLEQKGLEEIKAVGEPFCTDLHEAITNLPAESEEMKGRVVDEIEKGYMLNGTVIRYSKVAVAN
jgi:molecular chaperone GrpE